MKGRLLLIGTIVLTSTIPACSSPAPAPPATPTATLAPDKGRVVGILQVRSANGNPQPVKNKNLYLGEAVKDSTGVEVVVGFDRVNSPRVITDDQGRFAFQNITPGNYGLIYDLVFNAFLLSKPDSEAEAAVMVTVVPGKEVDLGTLLYESLPVLPGSPPYPYP